MRIALFAAALSTLAVTACAPYESTSSSMAAPTGGAALAGGEWKVATINGQPIVANSTPTITFEEGRVFGAGSCNRFMGGYTVSADGLKLEMSQMASTMMACPDALMQQEGQYLATLAAVNSYSVAGNMLTLRTADGQTVTAKR